MSHRKISAALSTRLNSLAGTTPKAYENSGYTPGEGTAWLRESYLPAETITVGMGDADSNDFRGVYQIGIYTPAGKSKYESHQLVEAIAAHFVRGTVLTFEGQAVTLTSTSIGPGITSGAWYLVPVSVRFRAFADNV